MIYRPRNHLVAPKTAFMFTYVKQHLEKQLKNDQRVNRQELEKIQSRLESPKKKLVVMQIQVSNQQSVEVVCLTS